MCHRLFCNCSKIKQIGEKTQELIFEINEIYQTIATGGLIATTFTLLAKEMLDYHAPIWLQLSLIYAAGLLSLSITKYKQQTEDFTESESLNQI